MLTCPEHPCHLVTLTLANSKQEFMYVPTEDLKAFLLLASADLQPGEKLEHRVAVETDEPLDIVGSLHTVEV